MPDEKNFGILEDSEYKADFNQRCLKFFMPGGLIYESDLYGND